MSDDPPELDDEAHPTGALQATEALTAVWDAFCAQGGREVDPEASLVGGRTLNPADPDSKVLGPAAVELTELEPLRLQGDDPQFRDVRVIGEGGMGQVRLALDRGLRREVALKTVRPGAPERETQALVQEAFFTGYLEHPNVVPVHRLGQSEAGAPVLVMKRVVGTSWLELLRDPQHHGWSDLAEDRLRANLGILIRVCDAVRFAHSKGILHRDIKPANVMVGEFGEVYLVDWGAAVRVRDLADLPATIVGTLAYMAPEMLEEPTALDPRTDVYLLGATLHHALTGKPRHQGSGHYALIHKVFRSEPHDYGPEVPDELAELCTRATHVDPDQRPESALAFRRALEEFLDHRGSITLTDRADAQRAELGALYAADADPAATRALLDACRFRYEQALEIWPGNEDATRGLQACLELGIEHELGRRNRGLVEALIVALPEPRPALEQRLAELTKVLEVEAAAPEQLAALKREHDPSVRSRERAWALFYATLLSNVVSLGVFLLVRYELAVPSYPLFALAGLLVGGVLATNLYLYREALLAETINRRLVGVVAAGFATSMLALGTCWVYGFPFNIYLMELGLIFVTVGAVTTVTVDRRLWLPTLVGAAACFVDAVAPGQDPVLVHVISGVLIYGLIVAIWLRAPREA
ncbi:MAG: serine/threonine protein kinase [Planctomycetes bacterium]|nr:serine/threonine protein kinase [Planctomycetota bacterium]